MKMNDVSNLAAKFRKSTVVVYRGVAKEMGHPFLLTLLVLPLQRCISTKSDQ